MVLSVMVVLGIILAALIKFYGLRVVHAFVAVTFGVFISETQGGEVIRTFVEAIQTSVNNL